MKYLFILIFLPLFSIAQVNEQQLTGTWVKVKARMKDGSRIVDHYGCGMNFIKYNFGADGSLQLGTDPIFEGYKLPHKILGDSLVAGGNTWKILGLDNDTLKLSLFAPFGAEDKQIPVYYFVRTMNHSPNTTATFSAAIKDSVYQATGELFPQFKGNFGDLMTAIGLGRYDKGTIHASFIIDKKGRVKSPTVLSADSVSAGFAKAVVNGLGGVTWIPAKKNFLPVNTLIQVDIHTSSNAGGIISMRLNYPFLPKPPYAPLDPDEAEASRQFLNQALTQANNQNFDKALQLLGKCIEIDKVDLNAYYLRAMVYTNMNKRAEACKDWTTLAGLGQVTAMENLAKFCKN